MKAYNYQVLLMPEPERGFTVSVPTLLGWIIYSETVDEHYFLGLSLRSDCLDSWVSQFVDQVVRKQTCPQLIDGLMCLFGFDLEGNPGLVATS